jgi:hypothetical protein
MKTLLLGLVLGVAVLAGCASDSNSEGEMSVVETTVKPQLTAVEIGEAFAYYSAQELGTPGVPDPTWSNPAATGKAVLDYCHDLGVTTVAAADEALLDNLVKLTLAGYLRGKTPAEAQTAVSNSYGLKEIQRITLNRTTSKAKVYCPE